MNKLTEKFLAKLHSLSNEKYNFLQWQEVLFDEKQNLLTLSFIYPQDKVFDQNDRLVLAEVAREIVGLPLKVEVVANKSFIESDLIKREIKRFLDKNNKLLALKLNLDEVSVDIQDTVHVNFNLEEKLFTYFQKAKLDGVLSDHLNNRFCAKFSVTSTCGDKEEIVEGFLDDRLSKVKRKSELEALYLKNKDKYFVKNVKTIVGRPITFNPRFINSLEKDYEELVVGGQISLITERSYTKTRKVKNKNEEETVTKPYFKFHLKDTTGDLDGVIFPNKTNYHKMHLLSNGNSVLVCGKIARNNGKFEVVARDISLCDMPNKDDIQKEAEEEITDYRYVKPQKYVVREQGFLFSDNRIFSREIQNSTFVVYDFETTGTDINNDEIIEIGALKIEKGKFTEVFQTLVKPKGLIPAGATRVNNITNDMVRNAPRIEHAIRDFFLFCKGAQMVGYNNMGFDNFFLQRAGKTIGVNFNNTQIDAFMLAKQKLKGLTRFKLGVVADYLQVNLIDAHRALNDVLATAEVFLKLY